MTYPVDFPDSLTLLERKCRERWYPLRDHPVQLAFVNDAVRFKLAPCGRRSGKTERAKRKLVKAAMRTPGKPFFAGAPTYGQAKKIWWQDLKLLSFAPLLGARAVSEGELSIKFPNGASIHVIGLDQPARIEGIPWGGGVIDEVADLKEDAIPLNVLPALSTVDPRDPD